MLRSPHGCTGASRFHPASSVTADSVCGSQKRPQAGRSISKMEFGEDNRKMNERKGHKAAGSGSLYHLRRQ